MSSSASDTFSPSPATGSASGRAGFASPPDDFFNMEEINVDAVPVGERPDYVLRAELQRAIALLCFTPPPRLLRATTPATPLFGGYDACAVFSKS